jgi:hypothetical protein
LVSKLHYLTTQRPSMIQASPFHPSMALGGIFLSLFGATWLCGASIVYTGSNHTGPNLPLLAVIVIATLALTAWAIATFRARRRSFAGTDDVTGARRIRKGFMIVNAVQWTGIGLAVVLLNLTGHVAWILPAVIWIVGVHFFPLARLFRYQSYILTGLALILVSVLTLLYGSDIGNSIALTLLATGAILWLTAVALLRAV